MPPPPLKTLEALLASPDVSAEDKHRAYKCWNRRRIVDFMTFGPEPEPLEPGDEVTIVGLMNNRSLNNCTGVIQAFNEGRWEIPSLSARVRPDNLVKNQWKFAGDYNSSVVVNGVLFTIQINNDKSVRFLDHNGSPKSVKEIRIGTINSWDEGYNEANPELSDLTMPPSHGIRTSGRGALAEAPGHRSPRPYARA